MGKRKTIVLITLAAAFVGLSVLFLYSKYYAPSTFVVDRRGAIELGADGAKIELVLFEDFQCLHCQQFSQQILPQIQARYIDPGMVRCLLVPLPLFPGSRALINAALAVFENAPDRFFPFLKASVQQFPKEAVTNQALLDVVRQVGGIDVEPIKMCLKTGCYNASIDKNLKKARSIMRKNVAVPMLYVDGAAASIASFESISLQIEKRASLLK